MSEAREQAWMVHNDADAWAVRARQASFYAGWDAAKRDDQQCIAALVAYVQHRDDCYGAGHRALVAGRVTTCVCGLDVALRALAGQSEEVKP